MKEMGLSLQETLEIKLATEHNTFLYNTISDFTIKDRQLSRKENIFNNVFKTNFNPFSDTNKGFKLPTHKCLSCT